MWCEFYSSWASCMNNLMHSLYWLQLDAKYHCNTEEEGDGQWDEDTRERHLPLGSFSVFHTFARLIENNPVKLLNLCFFLAFPVKTHTYLLSISIHRCPPISWNRSCDRICYFLIRRSVRIPLFLSTRYAGQYNRMWSSLDLREWGSRLILAIILTVAWVWFQL